MISARQCNDEMFMTDEQRRRQIIAESIAKHGAPVFVPSDQIPLGETIQSWEPGLPFVCGAVMRLGDHYYACQAELAELASKSGDTFLSVDELKKWEARDATES